MQTSIDDDPNSCLYPGDRLLEIEGINVETLSREDIVSKIKNAGTQVTLLVQSMQTIKDSAPAQNKYVNENLYR